MTEDITNWTEVTVTWMDGKQEIYRCGDWELSDGVLRLSPPPYPQGEPVRYIPLGGVRIWTMDTP